MIFIFTCDNTNCKWYLKDRKIIGKEIGEELFDLPTPICVCGMHTRLI